MKTLKHALLVVMFLGAFSNIKAQCWVWTGASPNGPDVQFYAYVDSNTLPTTYYWDFGDGDTSQQMFPTHTYASSGAYTICFHGTSMLCTYDTCISVTVNVCDLNPQVTYTGNNRDYTFTGSNVPLSSSYYWQVFDAQHNYLYSVQYNDTSSLTYSFPAYDAYYFVRLQTCTNQAPYFCCDSTETYVYVPNPCQAQYSGYQSDSTEITFYGYPYDSAGINQFTYSWDFGDGNSSSLQNPVHDFGSTGTWNVCFTVNGTGCADTFCQPVNVTVPPPPTYNIYGHISKGASPACASTIYLIQDSAGYLSLINSTFTIDSGGLNCSGYYYFWGVPQGTYYVKAALDSADADYANYLPAYYGDVLNWSAATAVNLNAHQYNMDIHLVAGVNPGGPGFVGGWVSQGAGMVIGGGQGSRSVGDPLPNVQINLLTLNDVPVGSTRTDANGRYTFGNLALGTYKIYAEEINKVPYPLNVTLTANNPSQDNVNVSVNSNSATTGIDDLRDIHVEGIFPNPVSEKATIAISLKQNSKLKMVLTDLTGRVVMQKTQDLNTGVNETEIDLSNQSAGVYELSLSNGADKKMMKLVKVN
jgi:hypothetical protein